jgi:hypothetical protein
MRVSIGLILLAVYFLSFPLIISRVHIIVQCTLIKVDWLAACIALRLVGAVFAANIKANEKLALTVLAL